MFEGVAQIDTVPPPSGQRNRSVETAIEIASRNLRFALNLRRLAMVEGSAPPPAAPPPMASVEASPQNHGCWSSSAQDSRLAGSLCPPELKVRTPAHTKQLGWYVEFESRVTHRFIMWVWISSLAWVEIPSHSGDGKETGTFCLSFFSTWSCVP